MKMNKIDTFCRKTINSVLSMFFNIIIKNIINSENKTGFFITYGYGSGNVGDD